MRTLKITLTALVTGTVAAVLIGFSAVALGLLLGLPRPVIEIVADATTIITGFSVISAVVWVETQHG